MNVWILALLVAAAASQELELANKISIQRVDANVTIDPKSKLECTFLFLCKDEKCSA